MKKLAIGILAFSIGLAVSVHAANLWELRDGSNVTQVNITDTATPVIEQADLDGNAATATALASDPTDCGANTFAESIDASGNLTCDGVDEASIDPSAVTTDKLANSAVTTPKLNNDAVTGEKILDGVVTEAKLSFDPATQSELDTHEGTTDAHFDHADDLAELNTQIGSGLVTGAHTTDTNASTICSGTGNYLDGEGNCDALITAQPNNEGSDTTANICTTTPGAVGRFMVSTDDFDLYTSTGSALPGQWRNSRTGIGPC